MKASRVNLCRKSVVTGSDLARVDHDEELHQVVVDLAAARLNDVDILATNRLTDLDAEISVRPLTIPKD